MDGEKRKGEAMPEGTPDENNRRLSSAGCLALSVLYAAGIFAVWLRRDGLLTWHLIPVFLFLLWGSFLTLQYLATMRKTHALSMLNRDGGHGAGVVYRFFSSRSLLFVRSFAASFAIAAAGLAGLIAADEATALLLAAAAALSPLAYHAFHRWMDRKVYAPWAADHKSVLHAALAVSAVYAAAAAFWAWRFAAAGADPPQTVQTASTLTYCVRNLSLAGDETARSLLAMLAGTAPGEMGAAPVKALGAAFWLLLDFVGCGAFILPVLFLILPAAEKRRVMVSDLAEEVRPARSGEWFWAAFWGVLFSAAAATAVLSCDFWLQGSSAGVSFMEGKNDDGEAPRSRAEQIVDGVRMAQRVFLRITADLDTPRYLDVTGKDAAALAGSVEAETSGREARKAEIADRLTVLRGELKSAHEKNIEPYLDWQFSVFTDYELLLQLGRSGSIDEYTRDKMAEILGRGVPQGKQEEYDELLERYAALYADLPHAAAFFLGKTVESVPPDAMVKQIEDFPELQGALERLQGSLEAFSEKRFAVGFAKDHTPSGLAAAIAAKGTWKLGAKAGGKIAAKLAAKRAAGAAAGASAGAAAGSFAGPMGTAAGGILGGIAGAAATWLGVDLIFAKTGELMDRDEA
ncbi:MAG: hypothetical protein J5855_01935, partial [Mailhella sp.]|nr:hypothetical protein [Mailhella sp.]